MGKLTAKGVVALKEPGRYADGDGLYLFIDSGGRKYWQLRYMLAGRRRDMAIGPERRFSLAQAREEAMRAKLGLSRGIDPLDARKEEVRSARTFAEATKLVHAASAKGWRIGKHQDQWLTTLENHAFPVLGNKPVAKIERADVVAVLAPIWLQIPAQMPVTGGNSTTLRRLLLLQHRLRKPRQFALLVDLGPAPLLDCLEPRVAVQRGEPQA